MKLSSVIDVEETIPGLPPVFPLMRFPRFNRIRRFFRNLRRSLDYAVMGWSNYDWDYGHLLFTLRFKLERMHKFLTGPDAIADHANKTIKSIRIAARLAKKLEEDTYTFFADRHHEQWKHVKVFEDIEPSAEEKRAGIALITRPINTPETAVERKEFMRAAEEDENIRKRDARWLFSIMEKYHTSWWD